MKKIIGIVIGICAWAHTALGAPVALSGTPLGFNGGATYTTPDGPDRLMVIFVGEWKVSHTVSHVSAITYNGVPLTRVYQAQTLEAYADSDTARVTLWYLKSPPVGTNLTIAVSQASQETALAVMSFINVNQDTPFGTVEKHTANGTPSIVSLLTGDSNSLMIDGIAHGAGSSSTATAQAGQTQRVDWINPNAHITTSTEPGPPTTVMSWVLTGEVAHRHAQFAVPLLSSSPACSPTCTAGSSCISVP
jgi:hypothetical protein